MNIFIQAVFPGATFSVSVGFNSKMIVIVNSADIYYLISISWICFPGNWVTTMTHFGGQDASGLEMLWFLCCLPIMLGFIAKHNIGFHIEVQRHKSCKNIACFPKSHLDVKLPWPPCSWSLHEACPFLNDHGFYVLCSMYGWSHIGCRDYMLVCVLAVWIKTQIKFVLFL